MHANVSYPFCMHVHACKVCMKVCVYMMYFFSWGFPHISRKFPAQLSLFLSLSISSARARKISAPEIE